MNTQNLETEYPETNVSTEYNHPEVLEGIAAVVGERILFGKNTATSLQQIKQLYVLFCLATQHSVVADLVTLLYLNFICKNLLCATKYHFL